jgi:hypothetical protein
MDVLPYSWDDLKLFLVVGRLGSFHAAGASPGRNTERGRWASMMSVTK